MQIVEKHFASHLVKDTLSQFVHKAFGIKADMLLQVGQKKDMCDYISPSAMKEFNVHKNKKQGHTFGCKTVKQFADKIAASVFQNDYISNIQVNQKGFLQIKLKDSFIQSQINQLVQNISYPEVAKQTVVVDFSSPNIAKEMHVGHLRSTIIGESICRVLQFMGHDVDRTNHVGDWGTQFGMLIAYMREAYPDYETNMPDVKDLDGYYKAARHRFDSDAAFKKLSQETVVQLQAYDEVCYKAWQRICAVSREYFNIIYKRLNISLKEKGQSFYNKMIPPMLQELTAKGLIQQDDTKTKKGVKKQTKKQQIKKQQQKQQEEEFGEVAQQGKKAKCIFIQKYPIPLIVVKSDGGFNYDSTDMAAIQYRLLTLKADRIIYITDSGQRQHFQMVIAAAKKAGWINHQRCEHMGFGVILGQDGKKFKTRAGKTIKLLDLLNQAKDQALAQLKSRQKNIQQQQAKQGKQQTFTALKPEQYEDAAQKLGMASIKYFDLKQNRISDYIFSFQKMLDPKGNTAIYLIYAYVRICSIIRKSGLTFQQIEQIARDKPFKITDPDQRNLAALLLRFYDVLNDSVDELALNKITDFIYDVAVKVQENYKKYKIVGHQHMHSRIILCEAIRKILQKCFFFVGIVPIDKI